MELRVLLCWASLAAALEGEFPWGTPPLLGPTVRPRSGGADFSFPLPGTPTANTEDQ